MKRNAADGLFTKPSDFDFLDSQIRFDTLLPTVFVSNGCVHVNRVCIGVQCIYNILVSFFHKCPSELAGSCKLFIISIKYFVKVNKLPDLSRFRKIFICLLDLLLNQVVDFRFLR